MSLAAQSSSNPVFKPVSGGEVEFINAKRLLESGKTGVVLVGILESEVKNQFEGTDYAFTRSSDGARVILNGCGSLKYQMAKVKPGTLCEITYNGQDVIKKGPKKGKTAHNFAVATASDIE